MKRHWSYFRYLIRHKWFVFVAGLQTEAPLWRLVIHDWSKFLPCEWGPYARSFYNRDGSKRDWKTRDPWDQMEFNEAWNHHQKFNKHHWQYWLLTNDNDDPKHKPLPIPEKYLLEMVSDWMGTGRLITGKWDVWNWYEANKSRIILNERTRASVEWLLFSLMK